MLAVVLSLTFGACFKMCLASQNQRRQHKPSMHNQSVTEVGLISAATSDVHHMYIRLLRACNDCMLQRASDDRLCRKAQHCSSAINLSYCVYTCNADCAAFQEVCIPLSASRLAFASRAKVDIQAFANVLSCFVMRSAGTR